MKKQLLTFLTLSVAFFGFSQITLVKDINPGSGNGSPANLYAFDNKIFFAARDNSGTNTGGTDVGTELWVSDGTEAGTVFVKDIRVGSTASAGIGFWFEYNNALYFSANNGGGSVLHKTDGTEIGTVETGDPGLFGAITVGSDIYAVNTPAGNKLWRFTGDNTAAAAPGSGNESIPGFNIIEFNGNILMYASLTSTVEANGIELHQYDPNTGIFSLVKDVNAGTGNSSIQNFVSTGTKVYFRTGSNAIWETDGTNAGTLEVTAVTNAGIGGITELYAWDGKIFFEGDTGASNDQLWVYDPIADTVTNLSNITGSVETGGNNHDPSDYAPLGDFLFYAGEVADDTRQWLFRTDGTTSERINDVIFDIDDLVVLNDELYFEGDDGNTGNELYKASQTTLSNGETILEIVNMYPNPAKDHVMFSQNMVGKTYTIFDAAGKQLSKGTLNSDRLDLNLASGLYLIRVKSDNSMLTKKIIIE